MSLWDFVKEEFFSWEHIVMDENPDPKLKLGGPFENVIDAIDPMKIAKRKILGVSPEEARRKFSKGDHLYTQRIGYTHHGIYIGNGEVVHYLSSGITIDTLETFADGNELSRKHSRKLFSGIEVARRARSKVGEDSYNVIWNNCEQFSEWCRNGDRFLSIGFF